ncbi:MAG: hypothetical protein ACYTGC_00070 [Planctomycetota bacterium]
MNHRGAVNAVRALGLLTLLALGGCLPATYDPARATRPYPDELHLASLTDGQGQVVRRPQVIDMQVFRDGASIEIVNSTARSFEDFDLWVNQRFMRRVESLPAGDKIRLSLWDFYDELGEAFNAGGLWRTVEPTPVRLVQIQTGPEDPLIGLITIRAEDVD